MDLNKLSIYYNDQELAILRILYSIRSASRNITKIFNQLLLAHGYEITIDQWRILRWLFVTERETLSNLCSVTNDDPGAVSRLVSRLENIGYVKRIADKHDKRKRYITVCKKSKDASKDLFDIAKKQARVFLKDFTAEDIELFEGLLNRLQNNFKKIEQ